MVLRVLLCCWGCFQMLLAVRDVNFEFQCVRGVTLSYMVSRMCITP